VRFRRGRLAAEKLSTSFFILLESLFERGSNANRADLEAVAVGRMLDAAFEPAVDDSFDAFINKLDE
jgi:hypothetical protein